MALCLYIGFFLEKFTSLGYYTLMGVLVLYLSIVVIGYFIGASLRKRNIVLKYAGKIQTLALIALVFLMGSRIGAEDEIVRSLDTIGLKALLITLMIIAGTVITAFVARKLLGFDKKGLLRRKGTGSGAVTRTEACTDAAGDAPKETLQIANLEDALKPDPGLEGELDSDTGSDHTMLLCIFVPVAIGILSGFLFLPDWFIGIAGTLIVVGLCILLFFVGLDLGTEGTIIENFKSAGWRVTVFPFVMITGTYLGALAASLIMPLSAKDALCVASGFGWYTLAPAMLAEYSIEVSAISFMHNVMRELLGILLLPFVAKRVGYIESTGLVGAGSMDVCLPIIVRTTSGNMAVYAFIIGVVLSIAVPVMVSFMMQL